MWNDVPQPITIRRLPGAGSASDTVAASAAARRQVSGWLVISSSIALIAAG